MSQILRCVSLVAVVVATLASTGSCAGSILNNGISGVHVGEASSSNAVLFAKATSGRIELLSKSNALNANEAFNSSFPFAADFYTTTCANGAFTPVLVRTEEASAVPGTVSILFVCPLTAPTTAEAFGRLFAASSADSGKTWSEPLDTGVQQLVLLKGLAPAAHANAGSNVWYLPVQTAACSLTIVTLQAPLMAPIVNQSYQYCVDTSEPAKVLQVTAAAWLPVAAANKRIALIMALSDASTTLVVYCDNDSPAGCWGPSAWSVYTSGRSLVPTGARPSLLAAANYGAVSPAAPSYCGTLPQLVLASQTVDSETAPSRLTFTLSQNLTALAAGPSEQTLVGALSATASLTAASINGIAVVPLPYTNSTSTSSATSKCVQHWAYAVTTSTFNATLTGSFTNTGFDPRGGSDADSGDAALAAAITFCIIGGVAIILIAIFVVGHLKNKKRHYESVAKE